MSKKKKHVETPEEKLKKENQLLGKEIENLKRANEALNRKVSSMDKQLYRAAQMISERNEWLDDIIKALKHNRTALHWCISKMWRRQKRQYMENFAVPADVQDHTNYVMFLYKKGMEDIHK